MRTRYRSLCIRCRSGIGLGDRTERVEAHHQLDVGLFDPVRRQLVEELGGEVQPSRRGGGTARLAGVDRLVTLRVVQSFGDVGRQRHLTVLVEQVE